MRLLALLLAFAAPLAAEDAVHLKHGGALHGLVVEENEREVVLELEAGRIAIPRSKVRLVERNATPRALRKSATWADEWFLVLHRGKVVGWRHVAHTAAADRLRAEERTVFFRPGGGEDVAVHRVEVADAEGRPVEFFHAERFGDRFESVVGHARGNEAVAQVHRDGKRESVALAMPEGWVLELPAWARFRRDAEPGEARVVTALDPRLLRPREVLFRREEDAVAPGESDPRAARALSVERAGKVERAFVRPDTGALAVLLSGETLVARRATRERVELAKAANARRALTVEEALAFPFVPKRKDLSVRHVAGGVTLRAADEGWTVESFDAERGRVLELERVALFASLEVFVYDLPSAGAGVEECLDRAVARLRLAATSVEPLDAPAARACGGLPALAQEFRALHRGERLAGLLFVARAPDRMVVLVGACPEELRRAAKPAFEAMAASLAVVP